MKYSHDYVFVINNGSIVKKPIVASYGNNKCIELHLTEKGIVIHTRSSAVKEADNILRGKDSLFADAIKKSLLLYAIIFGKNIYIKNAKIFINGNEISSYAYETERMPLIYSLNEGKLKEIFGKNWNDPSVVSQIATTCKSNYNSLFSALHALLAAKSNRFEIERFTYYWMAMNGLYSYVANQVIDRADLPDKNKQQLRRSDAKKQQCFMECCGIRPNHISLRRGASDKTERMLVSKAKTLLSNIAEAEISDFCVDYYSKANENLHMNKLVQLFLDEPEVFASEINGVYLILIWIPYKIRCASFHGEAALPTYCFGDERDLRVLRVLNMVLDHFLTDELAVWMNRAPETQRNLNEKIEKTAQWLTASETAKKEIAHV